MASYAEWAMRWRVRVQFLLVVPVLWFARPSPRLLGVGAVLVVAGLAVRAWAAGHLRKENPLTVSGPYAHLRHPLYLGSGFILAGFAVASGRALLAALLALYFLLLFVPVMGREERERRAAAPELYAAYAAQVPAFLPRLRPAASGEAPVGYDVHLYRRSREWRSVLGCGLLLVLLYARMVWG